MPIPLAVRHPWFCLEPSRIRINPPEKRAWHVGMRSPLGHLFQSAKLVKMPVPKRSAAQQRLAAFPLSPALQNSVQYFKIGVALRPLALLPSIPITTLTRFPDGIHYQPHVSLTLLRWKPAGLEEGSVHREGEEARHGLGCCWQSN